MADAPSAVRDYLERARREATSQWAFYDWFAMAAASGATELAYAAAKESLWPVELDPILAHAGELGEVAVLQKIAAERDGAAVQLALAQALASRGDVPGALDALERADGLGSDPEARSARHFAARRLIERALRSGDRAAADAIIARRPDAAPYDVDALWVEGLLARGELVGALAHVRTLGAQEAVSALGPVSRAGHMAEVLAASASLPAGTSRDDVRSFAIAWKAASDPVAAMAALPVLPLAWSHGHDKVIEGLLAAGDVARAREVVARANGAVGAAHAEVLVAGAAGELDQAEALAAKIGDPEARAGALGAVAEACARAGQHARALTLAKALPTSDRWSTLLRVIRQLPPEVALVEAKAMRNRDYRDWALGDVACARAKGGDAGAADAICSLIRNDSARTQAVVHAIEELLAAGDTVAALALGRAQADKSATGLVFILLAHLFGGRIAAAEAIVSEDGDARRRVSGWSWLAFGTAWQHGRAGSLPWRGLFNATLSHERELARGRFARLFPALRNPFT